MIAWLVEDEGDEWTTLMPVQSKVTPLANVAGIRSHAAPALLKHRIDYEGAALSNFVSGRL
jgi:hypothetical protein